MFKFKRSTFTFIYYLLWAILFLFILVPDEFTSNLEKVFYFIMLMIGTTFLKGVLNIVLLTLKPLGYFRKYLPDNVGMERKVHYLDSQSDFDFELNSKHTKKQVNNIWVIKAPRNQGAFMILNRQQLLRNKDRIKKGKVERSDTQRRYSSVKGFKEIDNTPLTWKGKKHYSYHRTHLLPYRFCLSEGDIDDIMITGTNHLNTGDRPFNMYLVSEDYWDGYIYDKSEGNYMFNGSRYSRQQAIQEILKDGYLHYNTSPFEKGIESYEIRLKTHRHRDGTPLSKEDEEKIRKSLYFMKDCHISLNDVEIFVDKYISKAPSYKVFSYGVYCNYDNSNTLIPVSVDIRFKDETTGKMLLKLQLDNVH